MKREGSIDEESSDINDSSSDSEYVKIRKTTKKRSKSSDVVASVKNEERRNRPKKRVRPQAYSETTHASPSNALESKDFMLQEPTGPLWKRPEKQVHSNRPLTSMNTKHSELVNPAIKVENKCKLQWKLVKPKIREEGLTSYVLFTYSENQFPESNADVKIGVGEAYMKGTNNTHLTLKGLLKPEEGAQSIVTCRYCQAIDVEETFLDDDSIIKKNFTLDPVNGVQSFFLPKQVREELTNSDAYRLLYKK